MAKKILVSEKDINCQQICIVDTSRSLNFHSNFDLIQSNCPEVVYKKDLVNSKRLYKQKDPIAGVFLPTLQKFFRPFTL